MTIPPWAGLARTLAAPQESRDQTRQNFTQIRDRAGAQDCADVGYRDLASRYLAIAKSLDFEGHIAWAEAMIEGTE